MSRQPEGTTVSHPVSSAVMLLNLSPEASSLTLAGMGMVI